jgi:general secretion pathway protein A
LQIMLVGQPELIAKLKQPSMRQFSQRIAASYHLTGLDREETGNYIAHRLKRVGGDPGLFTPAAVDIIYKLSGGIPRAINLVCQAALVYGFADSAAQIGQDTIKHISRDNLGIGLAASSAGGRVPGPAAAAAAGHSGNGFDRKLGVIEADMKDLKQIVSNQLKDIETQSQRVREGQFQQVLALLKQERHKNEELVRKLERLEVENQHLKRVGLLMRQKLQGPSAPARK